MEMQTLVILLLIFVVILTVAVIWLVFSVRKNDPRLIDAAQEARHRAMLTDINDGLAKQTDRIAGSQNEAAERLRQSLSTLQVEQSKNLAGNREELIKLVQVTDVAPSLEEMERRAKEAQEKPPEELVAGNHIRERDDIAKKRRMRIGNAEEILRFIGTKSMRILHGRKKKRIRLEKHDEG